ncbi:MAG TPA: hypothetical protein VGI39_05895 [Polyangiaceae bacterium]
MNSRFHVAAAALSFLALSSAVVACGSDASAPAGPSAGSSESPRSGPASLDEAREQLLRITDRLTANPADQAALQERAALQPQLDALNHLVARIAPADGHTIDFYEPVPGALAVFENAPSEAEALLTEVQIKKTPAVDLYRRLAGTEPPEALVAAQARSVAPHREVSLPPAGGAGRWSPDLTAPTAPEGKIAPLGGYSCFKDGDSNWCLSNWTGHAWVDYNAKTTGFRIQENSGPGTTVQYTQNGTILLVYTVTGGFYHWDYNTPLYWYCDFWGVCSAADYEVQEQRWDMFGVNNNYNWSARFNWTCQSGECPLEP